MSAMEQKSDSVSNESEDILTSTATETKDTPNVSPPIPVVESGNDEAPRTVSNDDTPPMTEIKSDEGDGMNSLCTFSIQHFMERARQPVKP